MKNISVPKEKLLKILGKNLETHKEEYKQLVEDFKEGAITELEKNLGKVREVNTAAEINELLRIHLDFPEDHSEDYKRVIGMLELTTQEEIELEPHEYQNYVEDNWDWSRRFEGTKSSLSSYSTRN